MVSIRLRENGAAKGCIDFLEVVTDTAVADFTFCSFRRALPRPAYFFLILSSELLPQAFFHNGASKAEATADLHAFFAMS